MSRYDAHHPKLRRIPYAGILAIALSSVSCAASPPASEAVPEISTSYAPFAGHYAGVSHRTIEQEFDGQVVTNESALRYFVSATVIPSEAGNAVTLVLDSVDVAGQSGPLSRAQLDSARGVGFTASLAPNGMLSDWQSDETAGSLAVQLADQYLRTFFPRLPDDGLSEGATWSDSIRTTAQVGGSDNEVRASRTHTATGWTEFAGTQALEIVTESHYSFTGSGMQVGQEFAITGTGTRHAKHYLTADGRYLGTIAADTSQAEAELAAAGINIPVRQIRADSLLPMP